MPADTTGSARRRGEGRRVVATVPDGFERNLSKRED